MLNFILGFVLCFIFSICFHFFYLLKKLNLYNKFFDENFEKTEYEVVEKNEKKEVFEDEQYRKEEKQEISENTTNPFFS